MSVLRTVLYPERDGHGDAVRLIRLAGEGGLEIGVPPQGMRADFRGDLTTPVAQSVLALLDGPGFVEVEQLGWPSDVTYPSESLSPETPVEGFGDAWEAIAADWNGPGQKPGDQDRWYVESHVARGRDVLVTDDQGMLTMCRRLHGEHDIEIVAESLADYAARFRE
jgi:hypothetical protein